MTTRVIGCQAALLCPISTNVWERFHSTIRTEQTKTGAATTKLLPTVAKQAMDAKITKQLLDYFIFIRLQKWQGWCSSQQ